MGDERTAILNEVGVSGAYVLTSTLSVLGHIVISHLSVQPQQPDRSPGLACGVKGTSSAVPS
jgi:hypothetical protein